MLTFSFSNPKWVTQLLQYHADRHISEAEKIAAINSRLEKIISGKPLVSIVIPAYNEEANLLPCIDSLSRLQTDFLLEIIVANKNSTDRTQEIIDRLHITATKHRGIASERLAFCQR